MSNTNDKFDKTLVYKIIYVYSIDDDKHKGAYKVGETTIKNLDDFSTIKPNDEILNNVAKKRINKQTTTCGIKYHLWYTDIAAYKDENNNIKTFRDIDIHNVLTNSSIKKANFNIKHGAREWFKTDLNTIINAINCFKNGRHSLNNNEITLNKNPVVLRPSQEDAIKKTINSFRTGSNKFLWNAKMRFGKTIAALELIKRMKFNKVLIITHRPTVKDSWYDDFKKIFYNNEYLYGSKAYGESIQYLLKNNKPFIYFASIQDLRESNITGGRYLKNVEIFQTKWDLIIIDESHEGTKTLKGEKVLNELIKENTKKLFLSGTPYNWLNDFSSNEIFTWDYVMEQKAKKEWAFANGLDSNPYFDLPKMNIFTYDLSKKIQGFNDIVDKAFNFKEFFKVWTKENCTTNNNELIGKFVHEKSVINFLDLLCDSNDNNYPFSNDKFRNYFNHTLWVLPGVKECKAMEELLKRHFIFGSCGWNIINVAGSGSEEVDPQNTLDAVKSKIGDDPEKTRTITLTCGRLTTGVTVPAWTAVLMLYGSSTTSAAQYMQTIFRVQSPLDVNGKIKTNCYAFDFAPDRALKNIVKSIESNNKSGANEKTIGEFLNFCPIISVNGSQMKEYSTSQLFKELKKVFIDDVVQKGFESTKLYNEKALKHLSDNDINVLNDLKKIIGNNAISKQNKSIIISKNNFDKEEYELLDLESKTNLTNEEKLRLEELNKIKKEAQKQKEIILNTLKAVSIRMPLLIFGANVDIDKEINIDNFLDLFDNDDSSWEEFMPKGVTKEKFKEIVKFYDKDIFIGAAEKIRKIVKDADALSVKERVISISNLFDTFKNPDKETVLTPWRVVNKHMIETIGGWTFFDKNFNIVLNEPRFVNIEGVTSNIFNNDSLILEMNSKTGLYPLFMTFSLFKEKIKTANFNIDENELWKEIISNQIFIICKTKMAKYITKRTLLGYKDGKINAHAFDNLIMQISEKENNFINKINSINFWKNNERNGQIMKFNVIVGNPPYQAIDGGGTGDSATPIYNKFIELAIKLNPDFISLINPSRWMKGGKGLDKFREKMLKDKNFRFLIDYENSKEIFPTINIDGGIQYFLWEKNWNNKCECIYHPINEEIQKNIRFLSSMEEASNFIFRDLRQQEIYNKVIIKKEDKFSNIVSVRNYYGIESSFFNELNNNKYDISKIPKNDYLKIWGVIGKKGGSKRIFTFINSKHIKNFKNEYKLFFSKAFSTNATIPPEIIIGDLNDVCTETFLKIGSFNTKEECLNCLSYMKTKFFRMLFHSRRHSMNISKKIFDLIPMQDFSKSWTDDELYKKYNLSNEDINYIEEKIATIE